MPYCLVSEELQQFRSIVQCYQQCIFVDKNENNELPVELTVKTEDIGYLGIRWLGVNEKTYVCANYQVTAIYPEQWDLPPHVFVALRNAIEAICAYQISRNQRAVGSGKLYDPTNLLCHLLKKWLHELALRDMTMTHEVKREIQKYIRFLKLLEKNNVFPSTKIGIRYERTMKSTLLEVVEYLNKTIEAIDIKMSRQGLRDVVRNLAQFSESVVNSSICFLFYILRSNRAPAAINYQDIRRDNYSDLRVTSETRSFKLLKYLVQSAYVQLVYRDPASSSQQRQPIFQSNQHPHLCHKWHDAGAVSSEECRRTNSINGYIGGNLIPDRSRLRRWWSNIHSGISGYFQEYEDVIKSFIELHSLTEKMAYFCLMCRDLEDLVDYFGAKIWAELGKKILDRFQTIFHHINREYHEHAYRVHQNARQRYSCLTKRNVTGKTWLQNFNTGDRYYALLMQQLENAMDQVSLMTPIMSKLRSQQEDRRVQKKLGDVVSSLNQFSFFYNLEPIKLSAGRAVLGKVNHSITLETHA